MVVEGVSEKKEIIDIIVYRFLGTEIPCFQFQDAADSGAFQIFFQQHVSQKSFMLREDSEYKRRTYSLL